jgi:hypothetical protein
MARSPPVRNARDRHHLTGESDDYVRSSSAAQLRASRRAALPGGAY